MKDIEDDLKARGLLDRSEKDVGEAELDRLFPNAQSRDIVTYE